MLDSHVSMMRDPAGIITAVDEAMFDLLGWLPAQLVGLPSTHFIHPEDQPSAHGAWMDTISAPGVARVWRGRHQTAGGAWQWVETLARLDGGETPMVHTAMTLVRVDDVSTAEALRATTQLLSRLYDALPVGVVHFDSTGRIVHTNERLHTIVGSPPAATVAAQLAAIEAEDRPLLEGAIAAVLTGAAVDDIKIRLDLDGGPKVCRLSLRALTDQADAVTGAIGCFSDVTDRVQLRRQLEIRASIDELTSCLNRTAILELLAMTLREADAPGPGTAVVFIDLDRFRPINDRYGHAAGDRLLVAVAERLQFAVRGCDLVGRLGGDEFLVICPGIDTPSQALQIGQRLAGALTGRVDIGSGVVELRVSIGISWTATTRDGESLIAQADSAMYESKRQGGSTVTLFRLAR